jgi:hypothetical protein
MSRGKGKISKTTCEGIRHIVVEDRHIEFAADGTPMGDQANQFCTFICMIARDRVPCNLPDWRDIPKFDKDLKDKMWAETKVVMLMNFLINKLYDYFYFLTLFFFVFYRVSRISLMTRTRKQF